MRSKPCLVLVLATFAIATWSGTSSALLVSPAGNVTASFGTSGLTFEGPLSTTRCPVTLTGSVNVGGLGSFTGVTISPNPCGATSMSFSTPWLFAIAAPSGGRYAVDVGNAALTATIAGVRCTTIVGGFSFEVTNGGTTTGFPSGSISTACGTIWIRGFGGRLTPAQTVI